MSGDTGGINLPMLCRDGEEEVIDLQGNRKCVPTRKANPFIAIWQGECGGWLLARLSFLRDPRPVERVGAPPAGMKRLMVGGADFPVEGRPTSVVGLERLKSRLEGALRKTMKTRMGYARPKKAKATSARSTAKARTRPKARAKTARRKK